MHPTLKFIFAKLRQRGTSYRAFDVELNFTPGTLWFWRRMKTTPRLDKVERAMNALGYRLEWVHDTLPRMQQHESDNARHAPSREFYGEEKRVSGVQDALQLL